MNVVFLDIDGVLNSSAYFEKLRKEQKEKGILQKKHEELSDYHLKNLAELVRETNAKIVLSSTWRQLKDDNTKEIKEMWDYLVSSLAKYNLEIYDITPIVQMNRPLEIKTWLDNQEEKNISFVSLDDDFTEEAYRAMGIGGHLVRTRFFCNKEEDGGLQPLDVEIAKKILKS